MKMEQDVDMDYRTVCTTCLSSDRDLFDLAEMPQVNEIFRLLMYDFAGNSLDIPEVKHVECPATICWECLAMLRRVHKFKWQVHKAQEHLRALANTHTTKTSDHTYLSQSLSKLATTTKVNFDKVLFDYSLKSEDTQFMPISSVEHIKKEPIEDPVINNTNMDLVDLKLEVPDVVLENAETGALSHIVVDTTPLNWGWRGDEKMPHLTIHPLNISRKSEPVITSLKEEEEEPMPGYITEHVAEADMLAASPLNISWKPEPVMTKIKEEEEPMPEYITEHMAEADMLAAREQARNNDEYANSVYKCECCIIGFYTQHQVVQHFETAHRAKTDSQVSCKICYLFVEKNKMSSHTRQHHLRYICKLCSHIEYSVRLIHQHMKIHTVKAVPHVIQVEGEPKTKMVKKKVEPVRDSLKPVQRLRKWYSKTTIEGYKCMDCDMFFQNSRAREYHVVRNHRERLQCDHCKKRFVNKGTLTTHLRLHEGPLPREECPICHKMVRVIQLKYHIRNHEDKGKYECKDCNKIYSYLGTYQAHLKYSRAHATEQVFRFPCPMCNKGYPTNEAMQDHFNYHHLGRTAHKCPICEKPIATKLCLRKHMSRAHFMTKEKPRNHICTTCGSAFTEKKLLTQHEAIHSGARPLVCDICQQTFKQKAALYNHRRGIHKVGPVKKQIHYMDKTVSNTE